MKTPASAKEPGPESTETRLARFLTDTIGRARQAALTLPQDDESVGELARIGRTISDLEALKQTLRP